MKQSNKLVIIYRKHIMSLNSTITQINRFLKDLHLFNMAINLYILIHVRKGRGLQKDLNTELPREGLLLSIYFNRKLGEKK